MSSRICDRCKSEMERISKRGFSRLLGRFTEVHRYQCQNMMCKREKLVFPELNPKSVFNVLLPYVIALGLPLLIILVFIIFTNSQPSNQPSPQSITPEISNN